MIAELEHLLDRQHPPLGEARQPDHDELHVPAAVGGPRVHHMADVLPVRVLQAAAEQVAATVVAHMSKLRLAQRGP